jgi:hypothetical protein
VNNLESIKSLVKNEFGSMRNFERKYKLRENTLKEVLSGRSKLSHGDTRKAAQILGIIGKKNGRKLPANSSARKISLNESLANHIIFMINQHTNEDLINRFIEDGSWSGSVVRKVLSGKCSWITKREFILEFIEWILSGKCAKTVRPNPSRAGNQAEFSQEAS